ncbi:hypothetical protein J2TS4_40210 [Paenibacillus sp. J2TS4]|nr:hypothetical protein J2TS4_40210 [Paenibacillus sp. J2TS4]
MFWLMDDLKKVDPDAYEKVLGHMKQNGYKEKTGWESIKNFVLTQVPMYKLKGRLRFLKNFLL